MSTQTRRVQPPPFIFAGAIDTRAALDAAMACPEKSVALLDATVQAIGIGKLCDHACGDAMVRLLLDEPLLNAVHLYLLTVTLANRDDDGLELARIALCSHRRADDDTLMYALWMAPTSSLLAVACATSRFIPNAIDWNRRRYGRRADHPGNQIRTSAVEHQVAVIAARWNFLTADDDALRSFISAGSFLFTDQRTLFAAGRGIIAAPGSHR